MSATVKPLIVKEEGLWILRFQLENGKVQEYRCASEGQAKQLAMVLAPPKQQA